MASMKEIKRRRAAIQSTAQITKAMKLVATVKLQKARTKADASKPYFTVMYQTIASMLEKSENMTAVRQAYWLLQVTEVLQEAITML